MKPLRSIEEIGSNENIILRLDTDLPIDNGKILDDSRLKKSIPTIRFLLEKNCKIIIVGHRGRPTKNLGVLTDKPDRFDEKLSLKPVYMDLVELLQDGQHFIETVFVDDIKDVNKISLAIKNNQIIFGENLRFWEEEEMGNISLFEVIKKYSSVFVNDAFAVAHRNSASIILHREMETYYGFSFVEEAEKINNILNKIQRPITIILGGAKEDKLKYLNDILKIADNVLIGGKLPKLITNYDLLISNEKIKIAKLREDGLDLSKEDISKFSEVINSSNMVIWAGAMGFYELVNSQLGTNEIAKAVANSHGYKIIAGGDTGASIKDLGLKDRIDFICSGGGVMLEMIVKGDLPAWI